MEENYHLHDQIHFGVSYLEIKTKTNVFKSFYLTLSSPCFVWLLYFSLMVSYRCHHLFPTFWRWVFEMKFEGLIGSYQMGGNGLGGVFPGEKKEDDVPLSSVSGSQRCEMVFEQLQ